MADHYGSAELIAGRLLARHPEGRRPVAMTKWCPEPGPMTPEVVRAGVQERLDRLGVARVDLLQFHWWSFEHPAWLDALHEMARLRDEGLIGAIGVTNFDAAHLALALADGIPLASNQVSFSLVDRRAAGPLSELCARTGVRLLAYGTLCGGFLADKWLGAAEPAAIPDWSRSKYKRFIDAAGGWAPFQGILAAAAEVGRKHGVSISNVATRWVLEQPAVAAIIVGARITESEHRADNLARLRLRARRGGPGTARRRLRGDDAYPGRLRRRVPQAAVPDRLGRPQPPSRRTAERLRGRAGSGSAGTAARLVGQRLGAAGRLLARRAGWRPDPRLRDHRHTWPRPRAWRRATRGRRRPTFSTRSPPRSGRSAAELEDVVRTRIFVRDIADWEAVSRAHGRCFGAIRPANTLVAVAGLVGDYEVEIEAEALLAPPWGERPAAS